MSVRLMSQLKDQVPSALELTLTQHPHPHPVLVLP